METANQKLLEYLVQPIPCHVDDRHTSTTNGLDLMNAQWTSFSSSKLMGHLHKSEKLFVSRLARKHSETEWLNMVMHDQGYQVIS